MPQMASSTEVQMQNREVTHRLPPLSCLPSCCNTSISIIAASRYFLMPRTIFIATISFRSRSQHSNTRPKVPEAIYDKHMSFRATLKIVNHHRKPFKSVIPSPILLCTLSEKGKSDTVKTMHKKHRKPITRHRRLDDKHVKRSIQPNHSKVASI